MDDEMIDKYLDYAESTLVLPNHPILYSWRKPDGKFPSHFTLGFARLQAE